MRLAVIAISLAVLAAGLTLRPTHNGAEDRVCEHPTSSVVRALYQTWETALRAGDVEALTALYSPDAILMGPGASSIRLGRSEIAAYYTVFVRHAPAARVIERVVRTDCGAANDIGLETVTFGPATNDRGTPARYSLSYALSDQRWLIVHHHQEMLEPVADDGRVADTASARIVTGTNPTTASPSAPPPADANRRMQFVLPLPRNP